VNKILLLDIANKTDLQTGNITRICSIPEKQGLACIL